MKTREHEGRYNINSMSMGVRFLSLALCLACGVADGQSTRSGAPATDATRSDRINEAVDSITAQESYRIGPGDILQVSVWREPEISVESVVVRYDGKISMPLIKEVQAGGLVPREFEDLLQEALARFIKDPDVTVIIREIHSQRIHVVGGVNTPGTLPLEGPTTVLQALAQAGGPTEFAKKSKIYVLRRAGDRTEKLPFDYKTIMNGKNSAQNILLRSGDTVVVPE